MTPVPGRVVTVVGPTATGKSELAVRLADRLGGEVVNADSMQLYAGLDVGTAKLPWDERAGVPHHLLDVWPVGRAASVADYQGLARAALDRVLAAGRTPVLVGGSGLYVRAAVDRLEFPGTDPELRAGLEAELAAVGPAVLHARLAAGDPAAAARVAPANGRRIVRALEVLALTGAGPGDLTGYDGWYDAVQVGLDTDALQERVQLRVDRMWQAGLVAEAAGLAGLRGSPTAGRAIGYAQALAQLDGELTEQQAQQATAAATWRLARRQRSWFRRDPRVCWLRRDGSELEQALELVGRA